MEPRIPSPVPVSALLAAALLAGSASAAPQAAPPVAPPAPTPTAAEAPPAPDLTGAENPPAPDLAGAENPVAAKIEAARRFVLDHPGSAHAWGVLAMSLDVHGFSAAALPCYRRAAELAPDDLRWPYYRAIELAAAGDPGAVAAFEAARALAPDYAPLAVRLGRALAFAGDPGRAGEEFARAAALDPGLPQAHLELARLALAAGDLDRALAEARRAVEAAPGWGEAHGIVAELLRRRGDLEGAARELAAAGRSETTLPLPDPIYAALAAEGVSSFWRQRRGRAYLERSDFARAARELGEAMAAAGDTARPELHDDLGLALQGLGRFAEAAAEHRAALALRPDFAAAQAHLGEALAETGDLDGAIAAAGRALDLDPGLTAAALDLGTLELRAGRRAEAVAAFRRGLAAAPGFLPGAAGADPRLAARLAWLLATAPEDDLRDGAEAIRLAEMASRATGDRLPEALDVLAAAYAEAGRFDEAAVTARRAGELAQAAGRGDLAAVISGRLALYEQGKPYRQEAPVP